MTSSRKITRQHSKSKEMAVSQKFKEVWKDPVVEICLLEYIEKIQPLGPLFHISVLNCHVAMKEKFGINIPCQEIARHIRNDLYDVSSLDENVLGTTPDKTFDFDLQKTFFHQLKQSSHQDSNTTLTKNANHVDNNTIGSHSTDDMSTISLAKSDDFSSKANEKTETITTTVTETTKNEETKK